MKRKIPVVVTYCPPRAGRAKIAFECNTIRQAEAWIAKREKIDPAGVHGGDYGIDASEKADAAYQRLKRRKA